MAAGLRHIAHYSLALTFAAPACATAVVVEAPEPPSPVAAVDTQTTEPDPQSTTTPPATPARPCTSDQARQFDFWIGRWEVRRPDGALAGHNEISRVLGGCVLEERYTAAGSAYEGTSLNIYDAGRDTWHQSWVDNSGLLLLLDGRFEHGEMRLRGQTTHPRTGEIVLQEIAWSQLPDGRVKQHWRSSKDGGKTWADAFVGYYTRITTEDADANTGAKTDAKTEDGSAP